MSDSTLPILDILINQELSRREDEGYRSGLAAAREAGRMALFEKLGTPDTGDAIRLILKERQRALLSYKIDHDDGHDSDELAWAALTELEVALHSNLKGFHDTEELRRQMRGHWPFTEGGPWETERDYLDHLVRVSQYLLAEIERVLRQEPAGSILHQEGVH